jgi:hypothetical protein
MLVGREEDVELGTGQAEQLPVLLGSPPAERHRDGLVVREVKPKVPRKRLIEE